MPKHGRTARTTEKTRTVYDICFALLDWQQHISNIARIVFQVCILDQHEVGFYLCEARAKRGAFSLIVVMEMKLQERIVADYSLKQFPGPVSGGVVDNNDAMRQPSIFHISEDLLHRGSLIEHWYKES